MSLRLRLLLVVATTFAVVVVGCVYAAHVSTRQELRSETDRFLMQRAQDPNIAGGFGHGPGPVDGKYGEIPNEQGGPQLAEPDAIVQLLDAHGAVVRSIANQPAIPVDATDKQIAANGGRARYRTVSVKGTEYRVLTTPLHDGGAAQIARSIADTNNVISTLDLRLFLIALIGTAVAAALAWLIARRIVRPVEQLTLATEQIARTQELDQHIEIGRHDELGRLATSFNTMLAALGFVARATTAARHGREPRATHTADGAAHEHRAPAARRRARRRATDRARRRGPDRADRAR